MKILAGIFGFIAVVYLAAWLYSLDLLARVGVLLLVVAAAAGLGR